MVTEENDPQSMHGDADDEQADGVTQKPRQGYVTMAYGKRKFFEMAANLALSVKLNDPGRPICLLYKEGETVPEDIAALFDDVVAMPSSDRYPGVSIKLAIYEPTPYDEALYVDSDCFIMKPDMDRHWAKYGAQDFGCAGVKRQSGFFYNHDVAEMTAAAGVDHMIQMNCGVLFYRKSEGGLALFEQARAYLDEQNPALIENRKWRRGDGLSDQPYFSAAMAKCGIEPVSYTPEEGTIMATTYRARDFDFDLFAGRARLKKPTGFRIAGRLWAKGWVDHDTSVGHFINCEPLGLYQKLSDDLRGHFDRPKYEFAE